jgi:putative nucleotidyltransferase with HDIG domain
VANATKTWAGLKRSARAFIVAVTAAGTCVLLWGALHWTSQHPFNFICVFVVALLASRLKVHLPVITGTMSVNFLFILLGIVKFSLPETLLLGCSAILVQCFYHDRPPAIRVVFNVCASAWAISAAHQVYCLSAAYGHTAAWQLFAAATTYFLSNTVPVALVISLTEEKSLIKIYGECYVWCLPYYLLGAGITGLATYVNHSLDWTFLLVIPAVYTIYRSYRLVVEGLEHQKRHAEDMASLHLRTIEALALAIEAKDHGTHDHLQRVRVYALEIAKELRLSNEEIEALKAAALLHDIGKLAVPEHIITKPGRLTAEEFEKMKTHPIIGAEILERVRFPYPVGPIVRAHHEKWDGSGYPFGLKEEEIPIGARILSALDFVDALSSDRPYRRALPLPEVMVQIQQESGKSFDPKIVSILQHRYAELENLVLSQNEVLASPKLSTEITVQRGAAPATGLAKNAPSSNEAHFSSILAEARHEAQAFVELSQDAGPLLNLSETLSVFSLKLRRLVRYDSMAIYIRHHDQLVPEHVDGNDFRVFAGLRIPVGEGLSGWVAQNWKPIINGNPMVEPGYTASDSRTMCSALAVPLPGQGDVVGVLTLYQVTKDAFTADQLRILLALAPRVGSAIEHAIKYSQPKAVAASTM